MVSLCQSLHLRRARGHVRELGLGDDLGQRRRREVAAHELRDPRHLGREVGLWHKDTEGLMVSLCQSDPRHLGREVGLEVLEAEPEHLGLGAPLPPLLSPS